MHSNLVFMIPKNSLIQQDPDLYHHSDITEVSHKFDFLTEFSVRHVCDRECVSNQVKQKDHKKQKKYLISVPVICNGRS